MSSNIVWSGLHAEAHTKNTTIAIIGWHTRTYEVVPGVVIVFCVASWRVFALFCSRHNDEEEEVWNTICFPLLFVAFTHNCSGHFKGSHVAGINVYWTGRRFRMFICGHKYLKKMLRLSRRHDIIRTHDNQSFFTNLCNFDGF